MRTPGRWQEATFLIVIQAEALCLSHIQILIVILIAYKIIIASDVSYLTILIPRGCHTLRETSAPSSRSKVERKLTRRWSVSAPGSGFSLVASFSEQTCSMLVPKREYLLTTSRQSDNTEA